MDYTGNFPILACVLAVITVASACYKIKQYCNNYEHNSETYTGSGYINGQAVTEGVKDCRLGFQKMSENGCEAIALYNAMIALDKPQKLADVVDYCEDSMWLLGYFGTHWEAIPNYLEEKGMNTEIAKSIESYQAVLQRYGYGIFTFWNEKGDITEGIHTVFIEYVSEELILVYNRYSKSTDVEEYTDVYHLIENGNLDGIQFVGVCKPIYKDTFPRNPGVYPIAI